MRTIRKDPIVVQRLNVIEIVVVVNANIFGIVKEVVSVFLLFLVFLRTVLVDSGKE
jgi:hypothetical protein